MATKIRLGLIGASVEGTWSARSHLPAIKVSTDIELKAVCTTKADSAEATRKAFGAQLAFDDYRKMLASDEIDAVSVVVRVPKHYAPTIAAIEAGKHVYCEWPLGRTTLEAIEMSALAEEKGIVTAVGLQARVSPALMYMKEMVESGFVGEVLSVHVSLLTEGLLSRPSNRLWQGDADLGANTLTIAGGHTIDAMRFVVGDLARFSSTVETQAAHWINHDTGQLIDVTSPDNILISGHLDNGAVASIHVASIPHYGSGYRMEIYGREGTLVATANNSPQMSDVILNGAKGDDTIKSIPVPDRLKVTAQGTPSGTAMNVGQMYTYFARSIRGKTQKQPNFKNAVHLHHLIDSIKRSSKESRVIKPSLN
jgi:predicted dehydrogenase